METSYQAATLNNSGVYHLLINNYEEATSLFQSSLLKTKELLHREPQPPTQSDQSVLLPKKQSLSMIFVEVDCPSQQMKEAIASVPAEKEAFVCKSAIIISHDGSADESGHSLSTIAISATYNLAIAHHVHGIRNRSLEHLRLALRCYAISKMMQKQSPSSYNPTHVLAILNNVAVIYRILEDEQQCNKFLRRLYTTMSILDLTGQNHNQKHWAGFWSNARQLVVIQPFCAAAA